MAAGVGTCRQSFKDGWTAVFAPTQTGYGERAHVISKPITLDTFVDDIANFLQW